MISSPLHPIQPASPRPLIHALGPEQRATSLGLELELALALDRERLNKESLPRRYYGEGCGALHIGQVVWRFALIGDLPHDAFPSRLQGSLSGYLLAVKG